MQAIKTCAGYVAAAKVALGDRRMSDRELGERLGGYAQPTIATAKGGHMSDPIALAIAKITGDDAGEVLMVARAERERDVNVKAALLRYMGKALRSVPSRTASAAAAIAVALSASLSPEPALAFGGVGGIRTLDAGFAHILP
jgi:hypothetical protein